MSTLAVELACLYPVTATGIVAKKNRPWVASLLLNGAAAANRGAVAAPAPLRLIGRG